MNNQPIQLSNARIFILGMTSLIMSLSVFLSVFAPYPLALLSIIEGRTKGLSVGLAFCLLSLVLSIFVFKSTFSFAIFVLVFITSILVSEVERLQIRPVKGVFISGLVLLGLVGVASSIYLGSKDMNLSQFVLSQIEENKVLFERQKEALEKGASSKEAFEAISLLSQPKVFSEMLAKEIPGYLIMTSFFVVWMNLLLLLRSKIMFGMTHIKKMDLLNIRLPDTLIWPFIVCLGLMLFGEKVGESYQLIGMTGLKALGVFYFFQGFGIYIQFLDFAGLKGFFRTMLIVFTLLTASYLIAFIGLFDMFFNFRKYFVKKENN